ncbi:uncharacterized protein V6R79_004223 [Siganus canaliculatus]
MKRAAGNQIDTRRLSGYFSPSPRSKVKECAHQQPFLPHYASSFQETPMKPSQVPNQLPYPPPRRMLPLQSPELCHRDRMGTPRHPSHNQGSVNSSGFTPNGPANSGSSGIRPHPTPRDRLSPSHYSAQPMASPRSQLFNPTKSGNAVNRSQSASSLFMKDLSNRFSSSHGDGIVRSRAHSSSMTPSINSGAAPGPATEHRTHGANQRLQNVYQPSQNSPSSDQGSGCGFPVMHSPVSSFQTPPSGKSAPPKKRIRAFEDCANTAKKLCYGENAEKAWMPRPTVDTSLSTLPVSQMPSAHASLLETLPKATDLDIGPAHGQSSTLWSIQSSCSSSLPQPSVNRRPSMGAKQAFVNYSENHTVRLMELRSPSKSGDENSRRRNDVNLFKDKSSGSNVKGTGSSSHFQLNSHSSSHSNHSTSALPAKTLSRRASQNEGGRESKSRNPKLISKPISGSSSCHTGARNKVGRPRKSVIIPDNINDLFTPDPKTYVVSPPPKTPKPFKYPLSCSSSTVTGSASHSTQSITVTGSPPTADTEVPSLMSPCQPRQPRVSLPTVALQRVKIENLRVHFPKDDKSRNSPEVMSSDRQDKVETVKCDDERIPAPSNDVGPCTSENVTSTTSPNERGKKQVTREDSIDMEPDHSFSSQSSDEEPLLSLQEMMEQPTNRPNSPEKRSFSEPNTPNSLQSNTQPLPLTTKSGNYKNNLDQMLKQRNASKRAKETEAQLLDSCKEYRLRIAECEKAEEDREEGVDSEHQEFLQRFSLTSTAIREVAPGEMVFNLDKFGQLFNPNTLQLRQCIVNPTGTAQKALLWSSPAQLRLHINIGLFQEAYDCLSPCPAQVTRFLFKMMSVHNERMVSEKILQVLCDIACTAASQIVKNGSQKFKVWVPSLADVALVLMNMGVAFVTLFPSENLQPSFTEGDLLRDIYVETESPSSDTEQRTFPEHNYSNILRYLCHCMTLCPRAYSDDELLLLLTVVGRAALDTQLILQSSVDVYPLLYRVISNIRDWDAMLPKICLALTDVTDDHHNMCLLVQLLPDNTRGKRLRRHLSLAMISKLLDGHCTYRPTKAEVQLFKLRLYLPRMQPTALFQMLNSSGKTQEDDEDMTLLDQQSYYLCYSLLTLTNEASNFQFFPAQQKEQLLQLSTELVTHVKCDIRESEKCLYRSKVKDLVARIETKWNLLILKTKPLHGQLYDYYQPPHAKTPTSSRQEQGTEDSVRDEACLGDEETQEKDTTRVEENDNDMISEDGETPERDSTEEEQNETQDNRKIEDTVGENTTDDTHETETGRKVVNEESNGEMSDVEPQVYKESEVTDEYIKTGDTEMATDKVVETRESSQHEAFCDLAFFMI